MEGLSSVCPSTNGGASAGSEEAQLLTIATAVDYTYQVEILQGGGGDSSGAPPPSSLDEEKLSEWISRRTVNSVASQLCASDRYIPCLVSLSHTQDDPGTTLSPSCFQDSSTSRPSICTVRQPNSIVLKHNAACSAQDLERDTLAALHRDMTSEDFVQAVRDQFPAVSSVRLLLLHDDNNPSGGVVDGTSNSSSNTSITDVWSSSNGSSSRQEITPAGIIMVIVTGLTLVAAIAVLVAWWKDRQPDNNDKHHHHQPSTKKKKQPRANRSGILKRLPSRRRRSSPVRIGIIARPPRTKVAAAAAAAASTTEGDVPQYFTEESYLEAGLSWHDYYNYCANDGTEGSLSSQSILEELEQMSKSELDRRTLRVPSLNSSIDSSTTDPHPDDEVEAPDAAAAPHPTKNVPLVRIVGVIAGGQSGNDHDDDDDDDECARRDEALGPSEEEDDDDDDDDDDSDTNVLNNYDATTMPSFYASYDIRSNNKAANQKLHTTTPSPGGGGDDDESDPAKAVAPGLIYADDTSSDGSDTILPKPPALVRTAVTTARQKQEQGPRYIQGHALDPAVAAATLFSSFSLLDSSLLTADEPQQTPSLHKAAAAAAATTGGQANPKQKQSPFEHPSRVVTTQLLAPTWTRLFRLLMAPCLQR